jgi:hypothetical protein
MPIKYGDFSSLVQLGVGLHVGTALLQLYGELAVAPLTRTLGRTRSLFLAPQHERPSKAIEEELEGLESRYEIFKIQLFYEYRRHVFFNLVVAAVLAITLAILAYKAEDPITEGWFWTTTAMVGLSILPGPISLAALWFDASSQVKPLRQEADDLEKRATQSASQR